MTALLVSKAQLTWDRYTTSKVSYINYNPSALTVNLYNILCGKTKMIQST